MRLVKLSENPFIKWIEQRIKKNKNVIIIINGSTGAGKTFAALDLAIKVAEKMETSFSLMSNMDFTFSGLLMKMKMPINIKPGTVFLFEEVGAVGGGASARQWQSKANSFFNSFMQTSRHKNHILIMTTPMFSYLDKGVRELCHLQITMKNINPQSKISTGKPFILQSNPISGKVYFKYLRVKHQGLKRKVKEITFKLPPTEIVNEYETIKTKYTTKLNKKIMEDLKPKEKKAPYNKKPIDLQKLVEYREKGYTIPEIAIKFKVAESTIKRRLTLLKKTMKKPENEPFSLGNRGFDVSSAKNTPF